MNKLMTKAFVLVSAAVIAVGAFAYNGGYENSIDWRTDATYGYGDYELTSTGPLSGVVGANAFAQCKALTSVDLSGVTSIGDAAFAYSALESVTIPASVTSMGYIAFGGCANLASVKFETWAWYSENKVPFSECDSVTSIDVVGAAAFPPSFDLVADQFKNLAQIRCPADNIAAWYEWTVRYGTNGRVNIVALPYAIEYMLFGGSAGYHAPDSIGAGQWDYINAPTRDGCRFLGWKIVSGLSGAAQYSDENGSGQITSTEYLIGANSSYVSVCNLGLSGGNVVLAAQWEAIAKSYSIQYLLFEGTPGEHSPSSLDSDAWDYISAPTRAGCKFLGWKIVEGLSGNTWYSDENGSGPVTSADYLIGSDSSYVSVYNLGNAGGNVVLAAQWEALPAEYTIEYLLFEGTPGYNSPAKIAIGAWDYINAPTREGCRFLGWKIVSGLSGSALYGDEKGSGQITSSEYPIGSDSSYVSVYNLGNAGGKVVLAAQWAVAMGNYVLPAKGIESAAGVDKKPLGAGYYSGAFEDGVFHLVASEDGHAYILLECVEFLKAGFGVVEYVGDRLVLVLEDGSAYVMSRDGEGYVVEEVQL